jgi:hypothetical protein
MLNSRKPNNDVRLWILKVIESCKTVNQINSSFRLIDNFKNTHPDMDFSILETAMNVKYKEHYKNYE